MSLSVNKNLNLFNVIDPSIDGISTQSVGVLISSNLVDYTRISANSSNQNSAQFLVRPPSNIYVGRKVFLVMPVTFNFTGTSPVGQNLLQSGFDAPSSFPLHSIMTNLTVKLNNSSVSINPREIQSAMIWANTRKESFLEQNWSLTPTMADQSQEFNELSGSIRNPLNSYIDSIDGSIPPRGAFKIDGPITNGDTAAELTYTFIEALQISPFVWTKDHALGFAWLKDMVIDITWDSDKSRMWSHDSLSPGVSLNTPVITLGTPEVLVKLMQPPLTIGLPEELTLPLSNITNFKNDKNVTLGVFGSGTDRTDLVSNNIELQSTPVLITIFAKRRNSDDSFITTDSFLAIESVSIAWDSRSGILAGSTQEQLYDISRKNGLTMSWTQFSGQSPFLSGSLNQTIGGVGSVLILSPAMDFGLPTNMVQGGLSTTRLQITAKVRNISNTSTIQPTLNVLVQYIGSITFSESSLVVPQLGIIAQADIAATLIKRIETFDFSMLTKNNMYGGISFFERVKNTVQKFIKAVPGIVKFTKKNILPVIKVALPIILSLLAAGEAELSEMMEIDPDRLAEILVSEQFDRKPIRRPGRRLTIKGRKKKGGRLVSRNELRSLIS